jgi:AraC-like DNA-binding protein
MASSCAWEVTPPAVRRFRFLPASLGMAEWGISVTGAGLTDIPPRRSSSLAGLPDLYQFTWARGRTLPEYAFLYVARGGGLFESIPTGVKNVAAGDAMVFFPGVWHRYCPDQSTGWQLYWVNGNGRQLHTLVQQGYFSPEHPLLRVGRGRELPDAYQRMLDLVEHDAVDNPLLLSAAMLEIVARLSRPARPASSVPTDSAIRDALALRDPVVARAVGMIWNSVQRTLTVQGVVASSRLARRSLERRFQNALGRTIYEEILRCRIERAKRVLQDTSTPIKQVALAVGFPNTDRMGKVFQRMVGLSPVAYRRCFRQA